MKYSVPEERKKKRNNHKTNNRIINVKVKKTVSGEMGNLCGIRMEGCYTTSVCCVVESSSRHGQGDTNEMLIA